MEIRFDNENIVIGDEVTFEIYAIEFRTMEFCCDSMAVEIIHIDYESHDVFSILVCPKHYSISPEIAKLTGVRPVSILTKSFSWLGGTWCRICKKENFWTVCDDCKGKLLSLFTPERIQGILGVQYDQD